MKNNRINIYIAKEDRKKLDELKVKYKLSLTTIVDILIYITLDCLKLNANKETLTKFTTQTLYVKGDKTSIKIPRTYKKDKNFDDLDKNKFANNCLNVYIKKEIHLYITNADILNGKYGYWNRINEEMQKRNDPRWQYNEKLREQVTIVKQNKDYFKKLLG